MANKRSVDNKNSRYVWGGRTAQYLDRAGWWERRTLERSDSDINLLITPEYHLRPDLMAYDLYDGNAKLAVLILQYNSILDVNTEFLAGKYITVPSPTRLLLDILNQPTGGDEVNI